MPQDIFPIDLVVEQVETEIRLRLRLEIQLSLEPPDLFGCSQAHRQSPPPRLLQKHTRSQGPFLRRHYPASTVLRPCPTPTQTVSPKETSRPLPSSAVDLPRLPEPPFQRAVPTTPADQDGGSCRLLARLARPSPFCRRVGVRDFTFEACSGFTLVTARRIAQPPKAAFVTGLRSLPETACQLPDLIDNYPCGSFLHW